LIFDFHLQGIKIKDRIDLIQRARLPGADIINNSIGDGRDQVGRDFDPVNLLQVSLNLTAGYPTRVHRDDLIVEAIKAGLPFLDELRFKLRVTVTWDINLKLPAL
jgi:hypothetical protein